MLDRHRFALLFSLIGPHLIGTPARARVLRIAARSDVAFFTAYRDGRLPGRSPGILHAGPPHPPPQGGREMTRSIGYNSAFDDPARLPPVPVTTLRRAKLYLGASRHPPQPTTATEAGGAAMKAPAPRTPSSNGAMTRRGRKAEQADAGHAQPTAAPFHHNNTGVTMTLSADLIAELEILSLFNLGNTQEGLKVHHTAAPSAIDAARRLHDKGLITLADGGYLTSLGLDAAEHAQGLLTILRAPQPQPS